MADMRTHQRIIEIDGARYRITDFDALSGGFVFLFVTKKILPLIKAVDVDFSDLLTMEAGEGISQMIELILPVLDSITQEDLQKFMSMCLERVEKELPAGFERIMRNGEWCVDDVKYSVKLAFLLCYKAVEGIIKDFFGEKALASIQKQMPKAGKQ